MDQAYYRQMYALEDTHWWFVARRNLLVRALAGRLPTDARLLDVGCGTGGTMDRLRSLGEVWGLDMEPLALELCRERGHTNLTLASATDMPYPNNHFDGIVALDVLEHIENHVAAAGEIARVLKPGGTLVVTVPAYRSLWSRHDVALHHVRRYRAPEMQKLLADTGLSVEKCTYTVSALFPAVWMVRRWQNAFQKGTPAVADAQPTLPWLNTLLRRELDLESNLVLSGSLPFGLTVFAIAKKNPSE
ncbi:MAG: methyltransferase domain-containing protein [Armatimonas sp.]